MASSLLHQTVDTWTIHAVVASRHLIRLYRALGDDKQASIANHSGGPAEERAQRLGLSVRIATLQATFSDENPEEVAGEAQAWQILVEAQAGICAFHAIADGHSEKSRGLQGARNAFTKAFRRAIQGYRVAFPEQMANEGISKAIRMASERCTTTFMETFNEDVGSEGPSEADVAREIRKDILEALLAEADLKVER